MALHEKRGGYSENENRTTATGTPIKPRQEAFEPRRGTPHVLAEALENRVKLGAASNDYASIDLVQFEEEPEYVQVAIERRIFAVPFDFDRGSVLQAIDLMSSAVEPIFINKECSFEFPFVPLPPSEIGSQPL